MNDLKDNAVYTSEAESLSYWNNEFGSPEYYSSFDELADAEVRLNELVLEKEKVEREIKTRNIDNINQYVINRAIELHFLVNAGKKYLAACISVVEIVEDERESEFEREYEDGVLFIQRHEKN